MLTGKMVRVRYARDRIVPHYLDTVAALLSASTRTDADVFGHFRRIESRNSDR